MKKNIPYEKFYDAAIDYFENNPGLYISKLYRDVKKHADELSLGIETGKMVFDKCEDVVWDDHEYVVLNVLEDTDKFYSEMLPFLSSFDIEKDIFDDLLNYQKNILRKPSDKEKTVELNHDIHTFLKNVYVNVVNPLEKKKHTLIMRDSDVYDNWRDFGKFVIWYGRMGWSSYKDDVTEI